MPRARLLPALLFLAGLVPAAAQPTPPAIRAWFGPTLMFSTDLSEGIGAGYDARVTIERPDVVGVSVVLGGQVGVDENNNTTDALFGAFLAGRSLPVAEDAFLHVAAGLGYARTNRSSSSGYYCDPYQCYGTPNDTRIGAVVPVRLELHVPYRRDRSFGIVAQAMLFGAVPNRLGLGLHYTFGRNLTDQR